MEKDNIASTSKNNSGILRVDTSKSRIVVQSPAEPSSPQPSVDRLSVSFAPDYERSWSESDYPHLQLNQPINDVASDVSVRVNVFNMAEGIGIGGGGGAGGSSGSPAGQGHHFSGNRLSANLTDEDDDYSASMTAILQRRASARKVKGLGKRRTSSPMDSDRRRSSVFTTSSGDTAITMDGQEGGAVSQEQIFENIRLNKEVIESVKQQPWDMRRKLKLVQQAKEYVKRHEGQLQERLAQSKSTKDIMARFNILIIRYWQHLKREAANLGANLIPWELRIKEIESHFGSVVASYFTFLRWVFWINIVISVILICLVIVPEVLSADHSTAGDRKIVLESEKRTYTHLSTLWDFEGWLKNSPIFYGYYTNQKSKEGFPLPLSYFITGMGVYIYSFVAILRRMASNSRQSKLSEKEDECAFSWRLFTAWDYMIGNPETAFNRFASITMGFKESLLEEKEKTKDERNWKVISLRVLANILILLLLVSSAYAVIIVVERSENIDPKASWWRQNEITLAMSLITTIFPNIFELIGMLENYHPRKQLRWQLARIMALNFLNLYTLIFALFKKVISMTRTLEILKYNATFTPMPPTAIDFPACSDITVNCTLLNDAASYHQAIKNFNAAVVLVANLTTLFPASEIASITNNSWISTANSKLNVSDIWSMLHTMSPKTDLTQLLNSTSTNPDFNSEIWSEFFETENYTVWTNQSTIDFNDTLWTPENRTALTTALPLMIKLINAYITTILPSISKTTPFSGDYNFYSTQNVTYRPPLSTSTMYDTTDFENDTSSSTFGTSSTPVQKRIRVKDRNRTRGKGGKRRKIKGSTEKPNRNKRDSEYNENGNDTLRSTEHPANEITRPDYSDYQQLGEEENADSENDTDYNLILSIEENTYRRVYGPPKMSTRGDMPGDAGEEITTSTTTTTAMPSPTTAVTTEPPPPENLDKFLTHVMTIVTMIFMHNSTKTDVVDYSKIRDFSKWITTLESIVETRKVTAPYNSTFGTTVKVNINEKEVKKCMVTICQNGTTYPAELAQFFNCTEFDTNCILTAMLGQRDDACWIPESRHCVTTTEPTIDKDPGNRIQLRKLCWETMFGQELVKLTVMDLIFTVGFILVLDFIRAILVRILNPCWCWDLEKRFPQYGDFKIAENILHLVNNQGMIWMGMFFSPGLPTLNLFKLVILMYIRSWAVMTCNVPHETVFRASRSNNFYFALLLFMLFLCTLPVAYAVVWLPPSWHCGPFSNHKIIYHIFTKALLDFLPDPMDEALDYIASPGVVIPLLGLLILIIYYLLSLTGALREANNDLKIQLRRERTEERRKMFKMAGGKNKKEADTPFNKWKMIIPMAKAVSTGKPEGEKPPSVLTSGKQTGFAGAAKRAAIKSKKPETNEDDGNATDVDQASLPEDNIGSAKKSHLHKKGGVRKPSCTDSVASTRSEIPVIKISKEEDAAKLSDSEQAGPSRSGSMRIDPMKRERVRKALIQASKDRDTKSKSDAPR